MKRKAPPVLARDGAFAFIGRANGLSRKAEGRRAMDALRDVPTSFCDAAEAAAKRQSLIREADEGPAVLARVQALFHWEGERAEQNENSVCTMFNP